MYRLVPDADKRDRYEAGSIGKAAKLLSHNFPKHSNSHNSTLFLNWLQEQSTRTFGNVPRALSIL